MSPLLRLFPDGAQRQQRNDAYQDNQRDWRISPCSDSTGAGVGADAGVGSGVTVGVNVEVGSDVAVFVDSGVGVGVAVGVGSGVGVGVGSEPTRMTGGPLTGVSALGCPLTGVPPCRDLE